MSPRRRHARLHLPPLPPRAALALVVVLKRAIAAIERVHGDQMREHLQLQRIETRARRHGVSIYNLDADPDADF